jgi:ABC-type sugar transport system permease subunit
MLDLIGVATITAGLLICTGGVLAALPRKRRPLLMYALAAPIPWAIPVVMVGQFVSWLTRTAYRGLAGL